MAKAEMQRRVYLLPNDLVDRVVRYQTERGMKSEVEAVRRLIDEALKMRDDDEDILGRFLAVLHENSDLNDAAREVLVGHPLVTEIKFHESILEFMIKGFGRYRSDYFGNIEKQDLATSAWSRWLELDYRDMSDKPAEDDQLLSE